MKITRNLATTWSHGTFTFIFIKKRQWPFSNDEKRRSLQRTY